MRREVKIGIFNACSFSFVFIKMKGGPCYVGEQISGTTDSGT